MRTKAKTKALPELQARLLETAATHAAEAPAPDPRYWDELVPREHGKYPRVRARIGRAQPCLLCSLPEELQVAAWRAYHEGNDLGAALELLHAKGQTLMTKEIMQNHYSRRHQEQPPTPPLSSTRDFHGEILAEDPRLAAVIRCVHRQRVLAGEQIKRLFYSDPEKLVAENTHEAAVGLRRLVGGYYLFEYKETPNSKIVYFLNRAGARFVRADTGETAPFVARADAVPQQMVEHDTSAAEIFVSMREQTRQIALPGGDENWQVILPSANWYAERNLTFQYSDERRGRQARIQPDGFAVAGAFNGAHSHCLPFYYEFDRGTRNVEDVVEQITNYIGFAVTRQTMQRFPDLRTSGYHPPLLFVMRKAERIPAIVAGVRKLTRGIPEEVRPMALIASEAAVREHAWERGAWRNVWRASESDEFTLLDALLQASRPLSREGVLDARSVLKLNRAGARVVTPVSKKK